MDRFEELGQTQGIQAWYSLKVMLNTVIVCSKIKRILEQHNILLACVICMDIP